jgi:hypothetical protein
MRTQKIEHRFNFLLFYIKQQIMHMQLYEVLV